jgi:hypothetical protein
MNYKSMCQLLPEAFTIPNRGETFIRIDDTKEKITYKISYDNFLRCILRDLEIYKREND